MYFGEAIYWIFLQGRLKQMIAKSLTLALSRRERGLDAEDPR
jgi:hypothetical protein